MDLMVSLYPYSLPNLGLFDPIRTVVLVRPNSFIKPDRIIWPNRFLTLKLLFGFNETRLWDPTDSSDPSLLGRNGVVRPKLIKVLYIPRDSSESRGF